MTFIVNKQRLLKLFKINAISKKNMSNYDLLPPGKNFLLCKSKKKNFKKAKTGVVMTLFMDWATY